jgi:hypothetical protein
MVAISKKMDWLTYLSEQNTDFCYLFYFTLSPLEAATRSCFIHVAGVEA